MFIHHSQPGSSLYGLLHWPCPTSLNHRIVLLWAGLTCLCCNMTLLCQLYFQAVSGPYHHFANKQVEWFNSPTPLPTALNIRENRQQPIDIFKLEITSVCRSTTKIQSCYLKQIKKPECVRTRVLSDREFCERLLAYKLVECSIV